MTRATATVLGTIGFCAFAGSAGGGAPDGSAAQQEGRLAIARGGIVLIDPDGDNARRVTSTRGAIDYAPTWSPDGQRIAFTRTTNGFRSFQVFVKRLGSAGVRRLTRGRFDERPDWSPDGDSIVYASSRGIRIIRPDGTGLRGVRGTQTSTNPVWSPDGRRLAFSQSGWLWTSRLNGQGRRRIARGGSPDWSPDGRRLAYTPRDGGVATIQVDGTGRRALGKGLDPAWSPDGERIAFTRWPPRSGMSVWVMNADGSSPRRVARPGSSPAWRPILR